jgi:Ner family transcriptional regulator
LWLLNKEIKLVKRELTAEEFKESGLDEPVFGKTSSGGMSRAEIRHALLMEGFTLKGLEEAAGLPSGAVNQSLIKRYPRIDRVVAAVLKKPLYEIWPDRYVDEATLPDIKVSDPNQKIREELREKGFTPAALERRAGLPKGSVVRAFSKRYPRVDQVIAAALNRPIYEVWPDRYLTSGLPVPKYASGNPEFIRKLNETYDKYKFTERIVHHHDGTQTHHYKTPLPPGVRLIK